MEYQLQAEEWKGGIEKTFYVHIVDITHGERTEISDPHGNLWEVYDPLARVGFYNPKTTDCQITWPTRDRLPEMYVPSMCYQRTLYCYVKDDKVPSTFLAPSGSLIDLLATRSQSRMKLSPLGLRETSRLYKHMQRLPVRFRWIMPHERLLKALL